MGNQISCPAHPTKNMKFLIFLSILFSANAYADLSDQGLRNWTLSNSTDAVGCAQQGTWTVTSSGSSTVTQGTSPWVNNISQFGGNNVVTGTGASGSGIPRVTVANDSNILATQSGSWTTGRTWSLLNTSDSVNAVQSGTWTVNAIPVDGNKTTYSASILNLASAASATDIFTINGSASKVIRINHIEIFYTQSSSNVKDFLLIKRSTADTGGTSSTLTNVSHDSSNAAGTAVVKAYTVNPTALGTTVGSIRSGKNWSATSTGGSSAFIDGIVWDFGTRPSQAIVLRGTTEGLAINLNAITITSSAINISIEWTEE